MKHIFLLCCLLVSISYPAQQNYNNPYWICLHTQHSQTLFNFVFQDLKGFFLHFTYWQKYQTFELIKLSRNKKDLNDDTTAPFFVSFSQLPAVKSTKNEAAVMSLMSFLFFDHLSKHVLTNSQSQFFSDFLKLIRINIAC